MRMNALRWFVPAALLVLLCASCGGGSGAGLPGQDTVHGFSLSTDESIDGGSARLSLQVEESGSSTIVNVMASDAVDLRDLLLHLSYDPERYNPSSQQSSGLLGADDELLALSMDREPGLLHYGLASTLDHGFSGSGIVASLSFDNTSFDASRQLSSPPALGNAAAEIDYNNLSGQLSWFYANPGDTNQDGLVNLADLVPIARDYQAVGPFSVSSRASVADANGDGEVNISDVSVLGANWNNDAFGGYNVYSSGDSAEQGSPVANVAFESAAGDPASERLRFSYTVPAGSRLAYAWVQPVDGSGSAGLSGDSVFADIVITAPTASFGSKADGGSGSAADPFVVRNGGSLSFAVYDPEDGDITMDPGLALWLEPSEAGSVANGMLDVSSSFNGDFVMRGSYQDEDVLLLTSAKTASNAGQDDGDGAFFRIDGCLELRLDDPELDGSGSIWDPYVVNTAGATLDFSVWHCDFGDISNSEMLSWGWQPDGSGEFNWDNKSYTFFQQFTGLWVIEVQWQHEGAVFSDHLYFVVDPAGGGGEEPSLDLKILDGYVDGAGNAENPYIICSDIHEFGLKAWHSELGDITGSEHLIWHVNPENAGIVHPEWHQFNIAENFLGSFHIEIVWESAGQRLVSTKFFKVQQCEGGGKVFEIKVGEGISGGEGTEGNPFIVCVDEVWEFQIKAWHEEYGDVTDHGDTTWTWFPENSGAVHPDWHQFNMAEGFTGNFNIHAVHHRQGAAWEDTKFFKAVQCGGNENYVEIKSLNGVVDGSGTQENPWVICSSTQEIGLKGWHSQLEDITQSEHSTWIVDSPNAGIMHPEWHQLNLSMGWMGPFHVKLIYEAEGAVLSDTRYFTVVECNEEPHLALVTDLLHEGGEGTQELPYKFCQGSTEEIFFQVFHSGLGEITLDPHLSWGSEPAAAGEFRPEFSDFVVNVGFLGVFHVTCTYTNGEQVLSKTVWFKQMDCELPAELTLIVTNPPELGEGSEANPYIYLENPVEIGLKFLHPELGDITDNENVVWSWNPQEAGEFRPQWNDFRVADNFTGGFWISAGWPVEGQVITRKVWIQIGNS